MEKQFLQNVSRTERIRTLKDNAEATEEFTYPRALSQEELSKIKDESIQNFIKLEKLEEVKKEFMSDHKAQVDPIKLENKEKLKMLRSKVEEVTEEVFLLADHDKGMMGYYNADGVLVHQRSLMPNERQIRLGVEKNNVANL